MLRRAPGGVGVYLDRPLPRLRFSALSGDVHGIFHELIPRLKAYLLKVARVSFAKCHAHYVALTVQRMIYFAPKVTSRFGDECIISGQNSKSTERFSGTLVVRGRLPRSSTPVARLCLLSAVIPQETHCSNGFQRGVQHCPMDTPCIDVSCLFFHRRR